jgi:hypothetical protein
MSLPKSGAAVHFILSESILSIELSELAHVSGIGFNARPDDTY